MQKSVPQKILILRMTKHGIISLLTENFYERFAEQTANIISRSESTRALFELLEDAILFCIQRESVMETFRNTNYLISISKEELRKVEFRAAYVMECIYFSEIKEFAPYTIDFSRFFHLFLMKV